MKARQFNLDKDTFNKIFPFYFFIDESLSIRNCGKSLIKLLPDIKEGAHFSSIFKFSRPYVEKITVSTFSELNNQLVVIESEAQHSVSLRGQFELHENGYLFIGSPWFNSIDAVIEKKLTLNDFAIHDPLIDLLHVMNNLKNASNELKELLTTVNNQKNELKKANKEIHDIALFPTQNPDPLLRIDFDGNLLKTNPAATSITTVFYEEQQYHIQDFFKYIVQKIDATRERSIFEIQSNDKYYSFVCISLLQEGYINIYGREITNEKKNQEEIRKLSLVASANKNGVVLMNIKGEISWCNEAYEKIVALDFEEIIGHNILDFGPCKTTSKSERESVFSGFRNGELFTGEKNSIAKNGEIYWYKTSKQPIRDKNNNVTQYFAVIEDITLEMQNEEQLVLLSNIVEKNSNAVIITNAKGETEWINDSFSEMTGYTIQELLGKKPGHVLQGSNSDQATIAFMKNQIENGLPFSCEIVNYTKAKEKYWVRIHCQVIHDKQGEVLQYFATQENITLEKEFTQQLEESENRLKTLITNLQSGILLEDDQRKIVLVNPIFCTLFGIDAEPEIMEGLDCSLMADDTKKYFKFPDEFSSRIEEILKQRKTVIAEEIILADGRIFERSYIPLFKEKKYNGHLWSYDDVTIKKNYKGSLEAERTKYSNIIANMQMGLVEVDNDDNILFANQAFGDMSGFSLAELIGKNASALLLTNKNDTIIKEKLELRKTNKSDSYEVNVKTKNGEVRKWLISGAPNRNFNGEIKGSVGIHLDITEQKKMENEKEKLLQKLAKQNEYLNEYAHVVSHDLKSPLRSIHALLSWIQEDNEKEFSGQTQEYLNQIREKVERMDNLIQGILTYSKIEAQKRTAEQTDLNEVVRSTLETIHIPKNIVVSITNVLPTMETDSFIMYQLFQNLISNAVTYNDKQNGVVEIASTESNKHYIFTVKDNGIGIDIKYQNKIFQIFESYSKNAQSTGIGLAIVKKIVDQCDGKIWLESQVGIGTTFYIKLPKQYGKAKY
jgi:PAS domain S-box-containing protein